MASGPQYQVRALERALEILGAFSLARPELTLSELAGRVGIPKSTLVRLLSVLEGHGFLQRSAETEQYRIGIRAFEIGSIYIQTTRLEVEAQPFLQRLARECNQTANLAVLDQGEIVHLAVVPPDRPIRFYATIGQRESAHSSGLGKALLSGLSEAEVEAIVARRGLPRRTEHTITTREGLRSHLARTRQQGFAIDDQESAVGLTCVAAPIRDAKDRTVAAVSVSGPSAEFGAEHLARHIDAVRLAARVISSRLGNAVHAADDTDRALGAAVARGPVDLDLPVIRNAGEEFPMRSGRRRGAGMNSALSIEKSLQD